MNNHYQTLNVPQNASHDEIKKAYRKLCFLYHPDKNNGNIHHTQRFKELATAYRILGNPHFRTLYDDQLKNMAAKNGLYTSGLPRTRRSKRFYKIKAGRYLFSLAGMGAVYLIIANYQMPPSNLTASDLHTTQQASIPYPVAFSDYSVTSFYPAGYQAPVDTFAQFARTNDSTVNADVKEK